VIAPGPDSDEPITFEPASAPPPRWGRWVPLAAMLVLVAAFGFARLARHDPASRVQAATVTLGPVTAPWPQSANQVTASCTEEQVDQLVRAFVDAANADDRTALRVLVAGDGQGFMSYAQDRAVARSQLAGYLAARHLQHETITLRSLDFLGYSGLVVSFRFELGRQADDIGVRSESGTGAATCSAGSRPRIADWVITGS
jgi:hypothetical protein